jgi:hypothetical protein
MKKILLAALTILGLGVGVALAQTVNHSAAIPQSGESVAGLAGWG